MLNAVCMRLLLAYIRRNDDGLDFLVGAHEMRSQIITLGARARSFFFFFVFILCICGAARDHLYVHMEFRYSAWVGLQCVCIYNTRAHNQLIAKS